MSHKTSALIVLASAALALGACGAQTVAQAPPAVVAPPATASAPAPATESAQALISVLETTAPAKINADLDAAAAYALAQGDKLGAACWPAAKAWLASLPPLPAGAMAGRVANRPAPAGAFTAWEYARVDRIATEGSVNAWRTQVQTILASGAPQDLMLGCGGMFEDEKALALRIAMLVGGVAAAPSVAPMLPAIGAVLPIPIQ